MDLSKLATQQQYSKFQLWKVKFSNLSKVLTAFWYNLLGSGKEGASSLTVLGQQKCLVIFGSWEPSSSSCVSAQDTAFPGREVRLCFRNKHLLENSLLCAGTLFSTCAVPASLQGGSLGGLHSHKVTEEKEVCACTTI